MAEVIFIILSHNSELSRHHFDIIENWLFISNVKINEIKHRNYEMESHNYI